MDKNQTIKNLSLIFVGVTLGVGASLVLNQFMIPRASEPALSFQKVPPVVEQPTSPPIQKPIYQGCACNVELAKLSRQIDDFPHGITEKGLQAAVQKVFDRRPCITYKELEKHFISNQDHSDDVEFERD